MLVSSFVQTAIVAILAKSAEKGARKNAQMGATWVTTVVKTKSNGEREYTSVNRITPRFSRIMKKVEIHAPKGTGFYSLRRTAATMAARLGDPFAVQRLLGHVDLTMATRYVQDVSEQTDRVIENSREFIIRGKS